VAVWETCQGRTEEVAPPIASTRVGLVVEAGVAVPPEERVGLAVGGKGEQFSLLVHCASALRCNPALLEWHPPRCSIRTDSRVPRLGGALSRKVSERSRSHFGLDRHWRSLPLESAPRPRHPASPGFRTRSPLRTRRARLH
jgi:hypothetical protein